MTSLPPFPPPTDTPTSANVDLLPTTLVRKIQKDLKLIANEAQELAEDLMSGLVATVGASLPTLKN